MGLGGRASRFSQWLGFRVRVILHDQRMVVGELKAFDKHMNLVVADSEEFRRLKGKTQEVKRVLGLVMVRGENVISVTAEGPLKSGSS